MAHTTTHDETMDHRDWLEYVARAGYAARGAVYVLIGVLALMAAFGNAEAEGSRGALATLTDEPFGKVLLAIIGIGLLGYAFWRFCQAFLDPDHQGSDGKGLALRAGYVVSGLAHVLLAFYALGLAFGWALGGGSGSGSNSDGAEGWTAWLMSQPFGRWLVGIVGLIVLGVAVAQFVRAHREQFKKYLFLPQHAWQWASPVSKAGLVARGVVFLIIGAMLLVAAYRSNPDEAVGLDGALQQLQQQSYGPWLLALVAIGLLAFSVYCFLEARYRKVDIPEPDLKRHLRELNIA